MKKLNDVAMIPFDIDQLRAHTLTKGMPIRTITHSKLIVGMIIGTMLTYVDFKGDIEGMFNMAEVVGEMSQLAPADQSIYN